MASDFRLNDLLRACRKQKAKRKMQPKTQLCWSCANACGGCSWSGIDPKTHRPRFEPVPGWKAKLTRTELSTGKGREKRVLTSYAIRSCPEFVQEERT